MSSTKGDQPPPSISGTGDPEPPGDAASSSSADIKPPTLTDSGATSAESDPPVGTGGGSVKDSSGIGE